SDALHGTGTVDTDVARHAGAAALRELLVVIDERLGLAMGCFQARLCGVIGVVGTLYERLPRSVILARYLWRMVSDVISTARRRVDATPREPFQHFVIAHVELDHVVEIYACRVQGVGLRDGAGKAIHDEPVRAIFFLDALFDELDHHAVRDELAFVHILFSFLAERRARLHRGAKHVAGGNLRYSVFLRQKLRLSAFARAGHAQQHYLHFCSGNRIPSYLNQRRTRRRSASVSTPGCGARRVTATAMR